MSIITAFSAEAHRLFDRFQQRDQELKNDPTLFGNGFGSLVRLQNAFNQLEDLISTGIFLASPIREEQQRMFNYMAVNFFFPGFFGELYTGSVTEIDAFVETIAKSNRLAIDRLVTGQDGSISISTLVELQYHFNFIASVTSIGVGLVVDETAKRDLQVKLLKLHGCEL